MDRFCRFPVVAAREAIRALLHEKLVVSKADKVIAELSKELVEGVKAKLKGESSCWFVYVYVLHSHLPTCRSRWSEQSLQAVLPRSCG